MLKYSNLPENAKKVIEWIWMSTFIAVFLYGAGSFIAMDLDVTDWSTEGRAILVAFWAILSGGIAASLADEH